MRQGYLRGQELYVYEDRVDGKRGSEFTPSVLLFCLFVLPSFFPFSSSLKETIFI